MDVAQMSREAFGARVRSYRVLRGWDMEEFGTRIGKSVASVSRIETGRQAYVAVVDIQVIARALGLSAAALLDEETTQAADQALIAAKGVLEGCRRKCQKALNILTTLDGDLATIEA